MPTIEVDGATIAYTDTGAPRPDAPVVVFGHGLLFGGWVFDAQIAALRSRFRCVAIDWRGQGASPPAAHGYDMDTLTADAIALIERLGLAPVHWVGLSMGGFVGQRLAARHGGLVRSLTLLDTSARPEDPAKAGQYRMLAWVQNLVGVGPVLGRVKPLMFGPGFLGDPMVGEWAARLRGTSRTALRKAVLGVAGRASVEEEITAITAPTMVVVGADDRATPPAEAEHLAARIPGARPHVVPDCGHTSPLEQPEIVTGLLTRFLAESASGGTEHLSPPLSR